MKLHWDSTTGAVKVALRAHSPQASGTLQEQDVVFFLPHDEMLDLAHTILATAPIASLARHQAAQQPARSAKLFHCGPQARAI